MPTAIILLEDGFEDEELTYPLHRLREAGFEVRLAADEADAKKTGKHGVSKTADVAVGDVSTDDYDVLVVPGGVGPDVMRTKEGFVDMVRAAFEADKPVAAICHGPQLLIEAGVVRGRTLTCWPSVRTDLENAGAEVVDQESCVDGTLVTARKPDDLAAWMKAFLATLGRETDVKVEASVPT